MGFQSVKQRSVKAYGMVLSGGLNYAQSPANIADNELKRASNFIYDPATDYLMTRPGTACQTAAALANPILKGYYYEKDSTTAYHVCASGGKLYYLSGASLNAWTEIGSLNDATTTPSFLTFNKKLLIADGGADIKTWDGTTFGTITGSPQATALSVIKNRVVANASDEPDSVYLSAPNDAESGTAWNTGASAVGLKAGYGDALTVVGFSVFGENLIVFKKGDREKRIFRVDVSDATAANWYVQSLSENNCAQNAHTAIAAWNNVFFVDTNGFKSLKGVQEYGDLQVDATGRKINTVFSAGYACDGMAYIPSYNAVWFNIGDRVFCYTERYEAQAGARIPAFTDINFKWGRCTSIYEAGDVVYLTGYNGYLYKLSESSATDETAPGVTSIYSSAVRGKALILPGDCYLRKLQWYLKPKSAGTALIYACTDENAKTLLKTVTLSAEGTYLYDATGLLNAAIETLYETGSSAWVETTRSRIRHDELSFELELTSGRCGVEWCKAEIAELEGR